MNILIIGGARFLGRALVDAALERGHQITLFNRGQTNPDLFPEVERITGDRKEDLSGLENAVNGGRRWHAVIDTCGYEPEVVRRSAELLADAVDRYVFISSISVYSDLSQPGTNEESAVEQLPEGADGTFVMEQYGALKALCEQAAEKAVPGRALNIRPGLIVGAHDPTDRFTYWPWRVAQGGDVLAPGRPEHQTQFIDVRDLAEWIIRMVEAQETGVFNATGPREPMTMGRLLETCQLVSGSDARLHWIDEAFLFAENVQPWSDLPLYLPENDPSMAAADQVSIQKALVAGLTFRPVEDTVGNTLDWAKQRPADHEWRAGLTRAREAELLQKAGSVQTD